MEDNKNAYSEVIEILKLVEDEERLEKLPMEMIALLKSKANPEYKPQISKEIPLEEQNLQPETYSIISWIATKYWGEQILIQDDNIEENNEIQQNKEINNINEIQEMQSNDEMNNITQKEESKKIEENNENINLKTQENNNLLPLAYKDLKWYQKIKLAIIKWINKIFKGKDNKMSNDIIQ